MTETLLEPPSATPAAPQETGLFAAVVDDPANAPEVAPDPAMREAVHREAVSGLLVPAGQQRSLAPWLFYDRRGSELFEAITQLPEYYLTRTERSILLEHAEHIVHFSPRPITVVELGAGNASKTGVILAAAARHQPELLYQPIDVSTSALDEASKSLTAAIPGLRVEPQVTNYITSSYSVERPEGCAVLALYIGSSIGNFSPAEAVGILKKMRKNLKKAGDGLILGVDLAPCVNKCVDSLVTAYDDAAGVTAEFNRNMLARLNRELGMDFDLSRWAHRARWNAAESRIEMHLESLTDQDVHLDGKTIHFATGETIHTENSYKFTERGLRALLVSAGFASPHWLMDPSHRFGIAMAHPA